MTQTHPRDPLIKPDECIFCPVCKKFCGVYKFSGEMEYISQCRKCRRVIVNRYDFNGYVVRGVGDANAETD